MPLMCPKAFLAADGAVAEEWNCVRKICRPDHRRTFFLSLRPHLHDHARSTRTTTPHLLERPVQQWAFLEIAKVGHTLAIPPPQGMRISPICWTSPSSSTCVVQTVWLGTNTLLQCFNFFANFMLIGGWALGRACPRICPFADGSLDPFGLSWEIPSVVVLPHGIVVLFHHRDPQDTRSL